LTLLICLKIRYNQEEIFYTRADFYEIIRHTKDGLFLIDIDKMAWHNILRRHSEFSS
jgi:hypothetical protein